MKLMKKLPFLTKEHYTSWNKIRNSLAHGAELKIDNINDLQNLLDKFHFCIEIFYFIIFDQIKFKGHFLKLSKHGWPDTKWYNLNTLTFYPYTKENILYIK